MINFQKIIDCYNNSDYSGFETLVSQLPNINYIDADPDDTQFNQQNILLALGWDASMKGTECVIEGKEKYFQYLVDQGADINYISEGDRNVLCEVAHNGSLQLVKLLVKLGADVNVARDSESYRPIHQAIWSDQVDVVKYLVDIPGIDLKSKIFDASIIAFAKKKKAKNCIEFFKENKIK